MSDVLRVLKPLTITNAMITAYDVPEPAVGDSPDPAAWAVGTTYALAARVHLASNHMIYESVQAGNIGHDPLTDPTHVWWVLVGATNRWRMLDGKNSSQTSKATTIDITLLPGVAYNGVAVLNVEKASTIQLIMNDPVGGPVFSTTYAMQAPPTIADGWHYFFDPIINEDTLIVQDLPSYSGATLQMIATAASPADVVAIGVLAVGTLVDVGQGVHYGAKVGIIDYSRKEKNAYGDYEIVERPFAYKDTFEMWIPRPQVDAMRKFFVGIRAVPCIFIGCSLYESTVVYGFYKDFEVTITYFDVSVLNLVIEGLT